MSLNPKITKTTAGVYYLEWTPDTTAEGYAFKTPSGNSRTFDPTVKKTKLGSGLTEPVVATVAVLDVTTRPSESAQYPPVVTPPPTGLVIAPPVGPFTELDGGMARASFPQSFVRTTGPSTVKKQHVKNVTGYGAGAMQGYPPTTTSPGRLTLEDTIVEHVSASPPKSMDGTGESCFWFGNPTDAKRFVGKDGAWMSMWTGSMSFGSVFEDFELDGPNVGLYVEHQTQGCTFRRFRIRSDSTGINMEWWYGGKGSHSNLFEDGEIYCPAGGYTRAGIFVDAGGYNNTFRRIRFWGPGAAIGLPNKLVDPAKPNVVQDCVFDNAGQHVYYHNNAIG